MLHDRAEVAGGPEGWISQVDGCTAAMQPLQPHQIWLLSPAPCTFNAQLEHI